MAVESWDSKKNKITYKTDVFDLESGIWNKNRSKTPPSDQDFLKNLTLFFQ